jgi:hypothetical protein
VKLRDQKTISGISNVFEPTAQASAEAAQATIGRILSMELVRSASAELTCTLYLLGGRRALIGS